MNRATESKPPIRVDMVFTDGSKLPITKARYVNGVERVLSHFETEDGERYVRAPIPDYDTEVCND